MTVIATVTSADEPNNINTMERKLVWLASALQQMNPGVAYIEQPGNTQLACQFAIFKATDGQYKAMIRFCVPMAETFLSDKSQKFWMHALEYGGVALPASYKTP